MKRILPVSMLATAVVSALISCRMNPIQNMPNTNDAFLDAVTAMNRLSSFDVEPCEKFFGIQLSVDEAKTTAYFLFYSAHPPPDGRLGIQAIELRLPRSRATAKDGLLSIALTPQSALAASNVISRFGSPTSVRVPSPEASKVYSLIYIIEVGRRPITFAIGPGPEQKIVAVTLDRTE